MHRLERNFLKMMNKGFIQDYTINYDEEDELEVKFIFNHGVESYTVHISVNGTRISGIFPHRDEINYIFIANSKEWEKEERDDPHYYKEGCNIQLLNVPTDIVELIIPDTREMLWMGHTENDRGKFCGDGKLVYYSDSDTVRILNYKDNEHVKTLVQLREPPVWYLNKCELYGKSEIPIFMSNWKELCFYQDMRNICLASSLTGHTFISDYDLQALEQKYSVSLNENHLKKYANAVIKADDEDRKYIDFPMGDNTTLSRFTKFYNSKLKI